MGIWSCLGKDLKEVCDALRAGRSGIGVDQARLDYGYRSGLTGIVERPVLKKLLDRRSRVGLSEEAEYAYMASREAFENAGITAEMLEEEEVGIIFGNDSSARPVVEAARIMDEKHDSAMLGSGLIFQSMNSTVTMNLSTIFRLRGINFTVSAACASGSHAIGLGYAMIKQGLQKTVLCGGAQEVNCYAMATFDALGALEDYDHAVARGAKILAEVVGYGFSSNGSGISQASDEGSVVAMQRALADAAMKPSDIDYINAHATSTPQGDHYEALALSRLFGGSDTWVSSTKSMTGHECWMAGASEVVYSLLMMQHGFVAPNINLNEPDEAAATLRLARETVECEVKTVLSNSFGFGGTNSALVLRGM